MDGIYEQLLVAPIKKTVKLVQIKKFA